MLEAATRGLLPAGNVARRLRDRPDVVRALDVYAEQVERIPRLGIEVLALDQPQFVEARAIRERYGLFTKDSLVVTAALHRGADALATADRDFERVTELRLFRPGDLDA